MLRHQASPQNLADWLAIATGKLVPTAQERVRAEIEAHYADAVQLKLAAGTAESAAQAAALADLGDAAAAARRLQQEHLTIKEAKYIGWRYKLATNPLWLIPACLILPMVAAPYLLTLSGSNGHSKLFADAAILLSVLSAVLTFGTWALAQQKFGPLLLRQILLLDCVMISTIVALCLISAWVEMPFNVTQAWEPLYFLGFALFNLWNARDGLPPNFLRLRRKLKTVSGDDLWLA